MRPSNLYFLQIILLATSTLADLSVACTDPETKEVIPVTDLCATYASPDNDVFAVGETYDGVCQSFHFYRGVKNNQTCNPYGGIQNSTVAIFCKTASCAAYHNYNCSGDATIDGLPINAPIPGGTPMPLIGIWGPIIGYTATCVPGLVLSPES